MRGCYGAGLTTPDCPRCGKSPSHCSNWTGTETVIWKCGSWKNDGKGLFDQSSACRIRELEQRVRELEDKIE